MINRQLPRANLEFLEGQFQIFKQNPDSIEPSLRLFFEGVEFAQNLSRSADPSASTKELEVYRLITTYRQYGHLLADLDPLKLQATDDSLFDLKKFNLTQSDLENSFQAGEVIGLGIRPLIDIITQLKKIYSGTLTCDVAGCEPKVQNWFQSEFESGRARVQFSPDEKKIILDSLIRTESLEKFIHTRFVGTKRFSIEGCDALMPMLESLVIRGTELGIEEITIGMAHRGRVNVLANFMGKAHELIFADFDGKVIDNSGYLGDVKYHLGYACDKKTAKGDCHISLAFNPSHLEFVDPVVSGIARAKQRYRKDMVNRSKVIPLLIHGDAAFAGQGVVSETLQLSQLDGYKVGGTLHIITNNQVGFTTFPRDSRSTRYSSDAAKSIKAPVILVNADDVEASVSALDLALRFRQTFKQDVVIDLIGYRRFGHNEGDEPAFTQPVMYNVIKNHPTLKHIYTEKLAKENVQTIEVSENIFQEAIDNLQKILEETRKNPPEFYPMAFEGLWKGLRRGKLADFDQPVNTAFDKNKLLQVGEILTSLPKDFNLHPKIKKLLESRRQMISDNAIDWGLAELLCYGSLNSDGVSVRLSGQDAKRGTFTHRHAVYFDIDNNNEYCALTKVNPEAEFCVYNSPLSEMAVLGFEYGNAIADPTFLTIWEAQFGDFANGAQVIIDQFLSSGEEKWARMTGLTLFLPHGYEGQGPEHSSARLERFLQLSAHDSMQVCNLTTPANLFHVLRRQMKRDFRKPLIIMTPKSLLRHPQVISTVDDLANGSFQEVLHDAKIRDMKNVENLLICSGKIYYDLVKSFADKSADKAIILRMEQICPFPRVQLTPYISGLPKLKRVAWVQEEPQNMGAYAWVLPRLQKLLNDLGLKKIDIEYIGRSERSSPAVGSARVHMKELNDILQKSLTLL
ncbi:MAG: 2-oxoglutarate dehydrogenase E1 component [Bdellovibrionales bacterium RBG_16_40_8]|nr:MAG: 2-oxoglutarate dehydrogenase E1 component [Bdellovibrionales bacterium RBG_16_40_8]